MYVCVVCGLLLCRCHLSGLYCACGAYGVRACVKQRQWARSRRPRPSMLEPAYTTSHMWHILNRHPPAQQKQMILEAVCQLIRYTPLNKPKQIILG